MAIRLGIVGTGKISAQLCDASKATPEFTLAALLSRDVDRGAAFAAENGIPAVYTDESAFLAAVDAVYIATPNRFHAGGAIRALRAGKHVLCEKPIATSRAEFAEMEAAAKESGRILLEGMRPLHDPIFALLREYLPRLGKLRQANIVYCQYSSRYDAYRRGEVLRAFDPSYKNAAIMDIGIYAAAVAAALFGAPQAVAAHSVFLPNGFEGCGEALLSYPDLPVTLSYSKVTEAVLPSVFYGEDGALTVDKLSAPREIVYYPRGGMPERLPYTPAENNMVHELSTFAALIAAGEAAHPYLTVSRDTVGIAEDVCAAAGIEFE